MLNQTIPLHVEIVSSFIWAGLIPGAMVAAYLLTDRTPQRQAYAFLAFALAMLMLSLAKHFYFFHEVFFYEHPPLIILFFIVMAPIEFMIGPAILLYTLVLTRGAISKANYWHLAWAGLFFLMYIPLMYMTPKELAAILYSVQETDKDSLWGPVLRLAHWMQCLVYVLWSLKLLQEHRQSVHLFFSNVKGRQLTWLQNFIHSLIDFIYFYVIIIVGGYLVQERIGIGHTTISSFGILFLIYFLSIKGVAQQRVFSRRDAHIANHLNGKRKRKFEDSNLREDEFQRYWQKLEKMMSKERPYLEHTLTLVSLAKQMKIATPVKLAEVIYRKTGEDFFSFINRYRVQHVIHLLNKQSSLTVIDMAFDAGFASKKAFYKAFTKITDLTPKEYRKILPDNRNSLV